MLETLAMLGGKFSNLASENWFLDRSQVVDVHINNKKLKNWWQIKIFFQILYEWGEN